MQIFIRQGFIKWLMVSMIWGSAIWTSVYHNDIEQLFFRWSIVSFLTLIAYREKNK